MSSDNGNGKAVAIQNHERRLDLLEEKVERITKELVAISVIVPEIQKTVDRIEKKMDERDKYCRATTEKIDARLDFQEKEGNLNAWVRKHGMKLFLGILLAGVGAFIAWLVSYLPS